MKQKTMQIILAIEGILCILFVFTQSVSSKVLSTLFAFPFEQIGIGLRALSLSGSFGNIVAILLYVAICLCPFIPVICHAKKNTRLSEDWLLAILSIVLFVNIYFMINPGLIQTYISLIGFTAGKAFLGSVTYSILFSYIILRVLQLFYRADTNKLYQYMGALLFLLSILLVALVFGVQLNQLIGSIKNLQAGNKGNEHQLWPSYLFLVLQYTVEALPYVLNIVLVFSALRLLKELRTDRYSQESISAADHLSQQCRTILTVSVLSNAGFNLLQLVFAKALRSIHGTVQLPLFSIAFVLAVLLLTGLIRENKQLKDDNDMFI